MKSNQQQMIASIVKEARPRSYTLKVLSGILDIPAANIFQASETGEPRQYFNLAQKMILSIGSSLICLLFFWAFLAQSRFPETAFEFLVSMAVFFTVLKIIQWFIWRTKK